MTRPPNPQPQLRKDRSESRTQLRARFEDRPEKDYSVNNPKTNAEIERIKRSIREDLEALKTTTSRHHAGCQPLPDTRDRHHDQRRGRD